MKKNILLSILLLLTFSVKAESSNIPLISPAYNVDTAHQTMDRNHQFYYLLKFLHLARKPILNPSPEETINTSSPIALLNNAITILQEEVSKIPKDALTPEERAILNNKFHNFLNEKHLITNLREFSILRIFETANYLFMIHHYNAAGEQDVLYMLHLYDNNPDEAVARVKKNLES